MVRTDLTSAQARRIALAAQGFTLPSGAGERTQAHLKRVVARTGLVQMDSVNIAARAHYMPMFSRYGAYDQQIVDRAAWRPRRRGDAWLVEYWAHEAALIPIGDWPLFGWRMAEFADGRYQHTRETLRGNRKLADDLVEVIDERGPSTPAEIEAALGIERTASPPGGWWHRGEVKHLCEALFAAGRLSAIRNENFGRRYELTERVVGPTVAARRIDVVDAHRELTARAASALGVATVADLADYYRLKAVMVRPAVADLVDEGVLIPVAVDGWRDPAFMHVAADTPRQVRRTAILSPFDPLIFFRPRAERLFDFRYRIEIYVPAHKRVHGYYVLPFLMGEHIVARFDLKADRKAGVLQVLSSFLEEPHDRGVVAAAAAVDLREMAGWLGCDDMTVAARGDLSRELRAAIRR